MSKITSSGKLKEAWSLSVEDTISELDVDREQGLDESTAKKRQNKYGKNLLREKEKKSALAILADQFKNLIIALLVVAAVLSFAFDQNLEGFAVAAVILLTALIGFFTEYKAVRSMEALREMSRVESKVRRRGKVKNIPAQEIVPGDIVVVDGGDIISADIRLFEASKLQADESVLTGESVPVTKKTGPIDKDTNLAERNNMLFKGTAVTRGAGKGVVVATGMDTELGNISEMVEKAEAEETPLEKRLDKLGQKLIWLTLVLAVVIAVLGIMRGKELFLMIETSIALAVAAIPEGLPIVATIALARGMMRMAKRNALINRLASVETLGATGIICSDKTGTLTENKMTVAKIINSAGDHDFSDEESSGGDDKDLDDVAKKMIKIGVLCNNASLPHEDDQDDEKQDKAIGEPLEIALLEAGRKYGMERKKLLNELPEEREEAFDSETKMMATYHKQNGKYFVAVKGAPEKVLEASKYIRKNGSKEDLDEEGRRKWKETNEKMAEEGLRLLAIAEREADSTEDEPYENMVFLGLVGMKDPPHADVKGAIGKCHHAGIRVIMVTGDQAPTARNIAYQVGLTDSEDVHVIQGSELKGEKEISEEEKKKIIEADIFSRVSPAQKLSIIEAHQKNNSIVAMTGDGVNDAPALKKADIGIAMGARGTQVAREASDMVLKDDAFPSIVAAVEQGRIIFNNIRKFVIYLMSINVGEILAVGAAFIVNAPLPLLPLQILYLNLLTGVFPALALGVGEGTPRIMDNPPRNADEPIMTRKRWIILGIYGMFIAIAVMSAFGIALNVLNMNHTEAVTVAFFTLALAQLWHVFNMRQIHSNFFVNEITTNKYVWGALILCLGLVVAAVYSPGLSNVLDLTDPGFDGLVTIIGMSLVPLLLGQIMKGLKIY